MVYNYILEKGFKSMTRKGTISKSRVKKNGEVFTPDEIVRDMCDLLDEKYNNLSDDEYIKLTALEPACGDGAILVRVLDRKLKRVQNIKDAGGNWEEALLRAVSSIYGLDITADNVVMSKRRLLEVIETGETSVLKLKEKDIPDWETDGFELTDELRELIQLILDYNIQCGNFLEGEQYKIYNPGFNCWTCDINLIDENHVYRHKVDDKNRELPGWETQKSTLWMTQWKFEGTDYMCRQCDFNDYINYKKYGQTFNYKTKKLDLYCEYKDPKEDLMDNYDF